MISGICGTTALPITRFRSIPKGNPISASVKFMDSPSVRANQRNGQLYPLAPLVRHTCDNPICDELLAGEVAHVVVNRDIWPVLSQHSLAVGLGFAERDGPHSGSLEAKTESSNAAEQI